MFDKSELREVKKFKQSINASNYEVLTDTGWVDAYALHETEMYQIYVLKTQNKTLKCADDHIVFLEDNSLEFVKNIKTGDKIKTIDGIEEVISLEITQQFEPMYDLELSINSDKSYYTNGILSHNTTSYCIFVCWYICFNNDKSILILANKLDTALEIMSRIRLAFELLPKWLKPGVKEWNKGKIELNNGCKVQGCATSSDAARSKSANCISGDSLISIRHNNTIEKISIKHFIEKYKFYDRLKIGNKETFLLYNDFEIETNSGYQSFEGIRIIDECSESLQIYLEDGIDIKCTYDHILIDNKNKEVLAINVKINDLIKTKNGNQKVIQIDKINLDKKYDILNVNNGNVFYANDILVHNCLIIDECAFISNSIIDELWSSVYPIISSSKDAKCILVSTPNGTGNLYYEIYQRALLNKSTADGEKWVPFRFDWWEVPGRDENWKIKQLESLNYNYQKFAQEFGNEFLGSSYTLVDPTFILQQKEFLNHKYTIEKFDKYEVTIWEKPISGHCYSVGVDVSDGSGQDNTVIHVWDITSPVSDLRQVAEFSSNMAGPSQAAYICCKLGVMYNNAPLMIERNNMGNTTVDFAFQIYEYENIISIGSKHLGILSNNSLKIDACQIFKTYSAHKMKINSPSLLTELEYFERKNTGNGFTYCCPKGKNDDHVMCSVWALFMLKSVNAENFFDVKYRTIGLEEVISELKLLDDDFTSPSTNSSKLDSVWKKIGNKSITSVDEYNNEEVDEEDMYTELGFFR